jgi:hypothetical protein
MAGTTPMSAGARADTIPLPPGRHDPADVPLVVAVEHPEKVGNPDGVPHDVIGIAAYVSVLIGAVTVIAWLTIGAWLAIPIAIFGAVMLMRRLPRHARRERREQAIDAALHRHTEPTDTPRA